MPETDSPAPEAPRPVAATVTAGMRGVHWDDARMDRPYRLVPHTLRTQDGQRSTGYLYSLGGYEKGVVCIMHPRELGVTHYLVPDILDAGYACWLQGARSVGNDLRLEHEIALFDVAAGMVHLRGLGFDNIVLLGNSGGASLYGFYQSQAQLAPVERIAQTPAGRPSRLDSLTMPLADRMVLLSPHPGQGVLLMSGIDGSATSDTDPFATDEALNPFAAGNGFDAHRAQGRYTGDFVTRYQLAQRARVDRIDSFARNLLKNKLRARKALKEPAQTEAERFANQIQAAFAPIFQVWRTDADLRSWDITLDPSDRKPGSLWGNDPFTSNYGSVAFARVVTPESWLSTWSGLSSNASFAKFGAALQLPLLMVEYTGDQCVFPQDLDTLYTGLGSTHKARVRVRGNHHGMALAAGEVSGQVSAGQQIGEWLQQQATQPAPRAAR